VVCRWVDAHARPALAPDLGEYLVAVQAPPECRFQSGVGGADDLAAQFVRGCPIVQVRIEILQNLLACPVQQFRGGILGERERQGRFSILRFVQRFECKEREGDNFGHGGAILQCRAPLSKKTHKSRFWKIGAGVR
jgi:hypothetical protein